MEIRQVLRGEHAAFSPSRPAKSARDSGAQAARPAADRLELSQQCVQTMEEQRARIQAAVLTGADQKEKSNGILDMLDQPSAEEEQLDAMSEQLDVQMKCLKIAMNMMKGKRVPPEDERYLMEHDPEGYKLAIAMRRLPEKDDEECESVLKDEDKTSGEADGTEETAPAEGGGASSGGEAADSGGEGG